MKTPDILRKIVARKHEELSARNLACSAIDMRARAEAAGATRGFYAAVAERVAQSQSAVIAEIKKASPSRGVIRAHFEPAVIARQYEQAGAACLSVLTDHDFFQGHEDYLMAARSSVALPVLRKDFTVDAYQVYEARAMGADCILLIVSILDDRQLAEFSTLAGELGMAVLVEVHDEAELEQALRISPGLLGINNRDLRTFTVDLDTTLRLAAQVPADTLLVTESGIHHRDDVARMQASGIYSFLVGEAFMKAPDPGVAMRELFAF